MGNVEMETTEVNIKIVRCSEVLDGMIAKACGVEEMNREYVVEDTWRNPRGFTHKLDRWEKGRLESK